MDSAYLPRYHHHSVGCQYLPQGLSLIQCLHIRCNFRVPLRVEWDMHVDVHAPLRTPFFV